MLLIACWVSHSGEKPPGVEPPHGAGVPPCRGTEATRSVSAIAVSSTKTDPSASPSHAVEGDRMGPGYFRTRATGGDPVGDQCDHECRNGD